MWKKSKNYCWLCHYVEINSNIWIWIYIYTLIFILKSAYINPHENPHMRPHTAYAVCSGLPHAWTKPHFKTLSFLIPGRVRADRVYPCPGTCMAGIGVNGYGWGRYFFEKPYPTRVIPLPVVPLSGRAGTGTGTGGYGRSGPVFFFFFFLFVFSGFFACFFFCFFFLFFFFNCVV